MTGKWACLSGRNPREGFLGCSVQILPRTQRTWHISISPRLTVMFCLCRTLKHHLDASWPTSYFTDGETEVQRHGVRPKSVGSACSLTTTPAMPGPPPPPEAPPLWCPRNGFYPPNGGPSITLAGSGMSWVALTHARALGICFVHVCALSFGIRKVSGLPQLSDGGMPFLLLSLSFSSEWGISTALDMVGWSLGLTEAGTRSCLC